jgi:hypothetical protein
MKSMFAVALFLAAPAMAEEVLAACDISQPLTELGPAIAQGDVKKSAELARRVIEKAVGPCADAKTAQTECALGSAVRCVELQSLARVQCEEARQGIGVQCGKRAFPSSAVR